jgi:hypothetical protein
MTDEQRTWLTDSELSALVSDAKDWPTTIQKLIAEVEERRAADQEYAQLILNGNDGYAD